MYKRVPFGYRNAPQIFMRLIDEIITRAKLRHCVKAFVDDITAHVFRVPIYRIIGAPSRTRKNQASAWEVGSHRQTNSSEQRAPAQKLPRIGRVLQALRQKVCLHLLSSRRTPSKRGRLQMDSPPAKSFSRPERSSQDFLRTVPACAQGVLQNLH